MRPLLVLAILLIGVKGAAPEAKFADTVRAAGANRLAAAFNVEFPLGRAELALVVAWPAIESADAAHDQDEEAIAPQLPAPAGTDADADADVAESLDGLCRALMTSAQDYDLPVPFFANLIWQESRLKHDAVSRVGAQGIAQFMPEVAAAEGVGDPFDPRQAIPASARLLHTLRQHFGNLGFAAAAYNAGPHRVGEWLDRRRALPRETRDYVVRVTGRAIEAWRKSPVNDSRLAFVKLLPCRQLPAFAELEQAQLREAWHAEQAEQPQLKPHQKANAAKVTVRIAAKITAKVALKTRAHAVAASRMARNFRTGKHEALRRAHAPHEKRRIA